LVFLPPNRTATPKKAAATPRSATKRAKIAPVEDEDDLTTYTDLSKLTKTALMAHLDRHQIEYNKNASKAELVKVVEDLQKRLK
jgi:hypothetical protein